MKTNNTTVPESDGRLTMVLVFVTIILSILNILDVLPLVTNQFYFHDDTAILYGVSAKEMPLGILTFTYAIWWRPIGFGLSMFLGWFFVLSPYDFHIIGLCIHFAVGATLWWFARRLFSAQIAWLSGIFFLLSFNSISSVGFPINAFQDGLFSCFFLLAWGLMFPTAKKHDATPKPYWRNAVLFFAAALCKDSWMGALPVMLATDWVTVHKSSLKKRLIRLTPFLILLPIPILHFIFVDINILLNSLYIKRGFDPVSPIKGIMAVFLPFINLFANQRWHYLLVFPVLAIMGASLYSGFNRARIVLIILMLWAILLIFLQAFFNIYWIQVRIASLATLSSILLALALTVLIRLFRDIRLISFLIIVLFLAYYFSLSAARLQFINFMTG